MGEAQDIIDKYRNKVAHKLLGVGSKQTQDTLAVQQAVHDYLQDEYDRYEATNRRIQDASENGPGLIIVFMGGKGGVSKSLHAAATAEQAKWSTKREIVAVDGSPNMSNLHRRLHVDTITGRMVLMDILTNLKKLENDPTTNPDELKYFFTCNTELIDWTYKTHSGLVVIPTGDTLNRTFGLHILMDAYRGRIKRDAFGVIIDTGNTPFDEWTEGALRVSDEHVFVALADDGESIELMLRTIEDYFNYGYENIVKHAWISISRSNYDDTPEAMFEELAKYRQREVLEAWGISPEKISLIPISDKLGVGRGKPVQRFSMNQYDKDFVEIEVANAFADLYENLNAHERLSYDDRMADFKRANTKRTEEAREKIERLQAEAEDIRAIDKSVSTATRSLPAVNSNGKRGGNQRRAVTTQKSGEPITES